MQNRVKIIITFFALLTSISLSYTLVTQPVMATVDKLSTNQTFDNSSNDTALLNSEISTSDESNPNNLVIYTSFYPIYDFVKKIGGDRVDVSTVVPAGVEPHDFEPTPKQIIDLQQSDVVFINGAGFEEWLNRIEGANIVDLSQGLSLSNEGSAPDPHVWIDPVMVKNLSTAILNTLISKDPQNAQYYENNSIQFNVKLEKLNSDIANNLTDCRLNDFIAFHDAFGYFAKSYGLTQHTITGLAPEGNISPQSVSDAINLARQLNISTIFAEENVDPRLSNTIANEIGGNILILNPIEIISQEVQDLGEDYFTKMYENLNNLKIALDCNI